MYSSIVFKHFPLAVGAQNISICCACVFRLSHSQTAGKFVMKLKACYMRLIMELN